MDGYENGNSKRVRKPGPAWGVLVYLAGDIENGHKGTRQDFDEIVAEGGSANVRIFVQYDGPDGARRHASPTELPAEASTLGRFDSGSAVGLLDFLRWGLSECDAERIALVIGTPTAVGMGQATADGSGIFTLTYDFGSDNRLDVSELGSVIETAVVEARRKRLDLLAIDSCEVQFLELAYELEGLVDVLIAPQTGVPDEGWNYGHVLSRWKSRVGESPETMGAREIAPALIAAIAQSYAEKTDKYSVSALDLAKLDEVARAFDSACIGTLQSLGEGLMWSARDELRATLAVGTSDGALDAGPGRGQHLYDCGTFFTLWQMSLEAIADEAYQSWLGKTLQRASEPQLNRFLAAVERDLRAHVADSDDDELDRGRLMLLATSLRARAGLPLHVPFEARTALSGDVGRIVCDGVRARMAPWKLGAFDVDEQARLIRVAKKRELAVAEAICNAFHLLPEERQIDLLRMRESVDAARSLAEQSGRAVASLIGDAERDVTGMVIAIASKPQHEEGWPRWTGASLFRPERLDGLMNPAYQRFAFHRRVHWAAMLGAANLIEEHPRALWRLVSSLLATGGAATRRDVLRRLTGPDSVVWGLRDQFRVMAPAPTVTLSLERRDTPGQDGADGKRPPRENYLLRLESANRGAIITEQESRVQPKVLDRALHELVELLQKDAVDAGALEHLQSIGGLLGEDIFQALGRTLDEERVAASAGAADTTPHLQLQIPRELMKYPWELLHHRREWLGERFAMGRQVFMATGMARRVPKRRQGRLRVLVVGDPVLDPHLPHLGWNQLPGARDEAAQLAEWFARLAGEPGSVIDFNPDRDALIYKRVTGERMRALLRAGCYDIVHFAGHGVFKGDDPETSAWLMSDGTLWALEIRNTLAELETPPWLVFANACEAGMDAAASNRTYQGNVFGLATAFINHGVAAYIAPLWPIDDMLAQSIALEFYRHLLCDRVTLGEALRRAKASARRLAYPAAGDRLAQRNGPVASWAGLGWASLVLYGDPSEELFQAMAGGHAERPEDTLGRSAERERSSGRAIMRPQRTSRDDLLPRHGYLQATDESVSTWVEGPTWRCVFGPHRERDARTIRGTTPVDPEAVTVELIEEAGLRRWRVVTDARTAGMRGLSSSRGDLPGSPIAELLAHDRVRNALPSRRGLGRVIGRWILSGLDGGILGLVRQYDADVVERERLVLVNGVRQLSAPTLGAVPSGTSSNRALLLVHGTFSSTASPVEGFGPEFIQWAKQRYRMVLGLEHWTLSKTPEENATLLAAELQALDPSLLLPGALDVISHSRGGLVARAFCELLEGQSKAVRNLIFLGTPNCGTDLANPEKWGGFADLLVNMTGLAGAELFGRLAGLLANLVVRRFTDRVPGLLAQDPGAVADVGSFLHRLQDDARDRSGVKYGVVCSEFEPTALVPSVTKLARIATENGLDGIADRLFANANDLVVNTAHAWCIGRPPSRSHEIPDFVKDRVLVYRPPADTRITGAGTDWLPEGLTPEIALGVHHCNLFGQTKVQKTIKAWLTEA